MLEPKLELIWIGKGIHPRHGPRILSDDPKQSCNAKYPIKKSSTEVTKHAEGEKRDVATSFNSLSSMPSATSVVNLLCALFNNYMLRVI